MIIFEGLYPTYQIINIDWILFFSNSRGQLKETTWSELKDILNRTYVFERYMNQIELRAIKIVKDKRPDFQPNIDD